MKKTFFLVALMCPCLHCFCWGFYAHKKINYHAVFSLPPQMMVFYKSNINFLSEHATDADKRRYAVAAEGPRHFLDIDHYGKYPFEELPRKWKDAVEKFSEDTLMKYGIVPWHVQTILKRLTDAFREKNYASIVKNSADIGHYVADAHVPLHASENHNGQLTDQKGIHAFWESRIPELLADKHFDFFVGKAVFINDPGSFIWKIVLESSKAADSVLRLEKELSLKFSPAAKYSFESKNNTFTRNYSPSYTVAFDKLLDGMVERRMRQSIVAVASFWYTAWVNAGQPDLSSLTNHTFSADEKAEFDSMNAAWKNNKVQDLRSHE